MHQDQLKLRILEAVGGEKHLKDRHHLRIDLEWPRSQRILRHYANQPQLGFTAVLFALSDLRRENTKNGAKVAVKVAGEAGWEEVK